MPDVRNYYVICEDNCKFESMTKEQIIAAIAEATGATPTRIDDAFITKIKESNANVALTFWKGTQAQFNALGVTAQAYKVGIDSNGKLYFTPFTVTDVPSHASNHASGGGDALTPSDIGALSDNGGTMGGNINMDSHKVTNLATPTENNDAATKIYVDNTYSNFICYHCGDESIIQRASAYSYMNISNINLPISEFRKLNIILTGYGRISDSSSNVVGVSISLSNGSTITKNFKNEIEISSIDNCKFNRYKSELVFENDGYLSTEMHQMGTSAEYKSGFASLTNLLSASITGISVTASNANSCLMHCDVEIHKTNWLPESD